MENSFGLIFGLLSITLWVTALVHDASNSVIGWLVADILVAPVGVIRGALILGGGV